MKDKLKNIIKILKFIIVINPSSIIISGLLCLVSSAMNPLLSKLLYNLVLTVEDSIHTNSFQFSPIVVIITIIVIASSFLTITGISNIVLFEKMQISVGVNLLRKIYTKTDSLPHIYFENNENASKIERITLYSQDSAITQNVIHIISSFACFLSLIAFMFIFIDVSILFFIFLLICAVIGSFLNFSEGIKRWIFQRDLDPQKRKASEIKGYFSTKNIISEMRILKSFDFIEKKWLEEEEDIFKKTYDFEKKMNIKNLMFTLVRLLINAVPLVLALILGSLEYIPFATIFLIWQGQSGINSLVERTIGEWKMAYNNIEPMMEIIDFIEGKIEYIDYESDKEIDSKFALELCDISFAYPGHEIFLKNISLKIKNGEKIAIIGANGSGKTTLIKVLSGLYKPSSGELRFLDTVITEKNKAIYTKKAGAIWQDYVNFELTVAENIGFGYIDCINNQGDIKRILNLVKLGDVYQPEQVLGKSFDENGVIPSEGQWQRIAIGRALFGEKFILFMDEPTASLDPIAEVDIFNEVKNLFKEKTCIFISHRIGFARLAERIIVMNNGCIVEDGNEEELLQQKGEYYNMYQLQAKYYMD